MIKQLMCALFINRLITVSMYNTCSSTRLSKDNKAIFIEPFFFILGGNMKKEEAGRQIYRRKKRITFTVSDVTLICIVVVAGLMIINAIMK